MKKRSIATTSHEGSTRTAKGNALNRAIAASLLKTGKYSSANAGRVAEIIKQLTLHQIENLAPPGKLVLVKETGSATHIAPSSGKVPRHVARLGSTGQIHRSKTGARRRAQSDDNAQMTAAELAKLRPVAPVKRLRWRLAMSQVDFSKAYGIPLGTLRDWEQGRAQPDAPARAYLKAISADPERVRKAVAA